MFAETYILLDSLLFKLITRSEKETVLLAMPEICANKIITLYHSNGDFLSRQKHDDSKST